MYTDPFPTAAESIKFYKSSSYVSHGDKKGFFFDTIYGTIKWLNIHNKLRILSLHTKLNKHLDIGCGTGDFLKYLNRKGASTTGIETDDDARSTALNKKLTVFRTLTDAPTAQYTSITMIHVLEHVHQLQQYLTFITEHLEEKGILFLALPNYLSHDAKYYKEYWAGYDAPRHLYHFQPKSVEIIAKDFGLKLVRQYPMKFDSYYVSLLSHQYASGKTNYLKAFLEGFKSNWKARKTGNFSSLIYILQK